MHIFAKSLSFVLFGLSAIALPATAADYPAKAIQLIVPYGPGGGTDVVGRIVASDLAKKLGHPVIVENRAGADSSIGSEYVARAAPDGYTFLVGASGLTSGPFLSKVFAVDPIKDFTHIIQFAEAPTIFVVNPLLPAKNMNEFITLAKSTPGKYNVAVFGPFGLDLLAFNAMAGINTVPVPFQGGAGPMLASILGNHVDAMFISAIAVKNQTATGQLRILGIGSARRSAMLPNVPTISETVPGYTSSGLWQGLSGPVGLPESIVTKLNTEINIVLSSADIRRRLAEMGFSVVGGSAATYRDMIMADLALFQRAAKLGGGKRN